MKWTVIVNFAEHIDENIYDFPFHVGKQLKNCKILEKTVQNITNDRRQKLNHSQLHVQYFKSNNKHVFLYLPFYAPAEGCIYGIYIKT